MATPAPRRRSQRVSINGVLEVASKAVHKLTEHEKQPEEDPDIVLKNPQWEDQLPPIHGVDAPAAEGKAQSTAALLAALDDLPRPEAASQAQKNWKRAYEAVKRLMMIRKKLRRSAVGTGARMEGHSLGFWSSYSPLRLKLFMIIYSQKAEYCLLFVICAHLLILILQVQHGNRQDRWTEIRNPKLDFLDAFITMLYTIEMFLRILVLGLYKETHTYLRNPYNRLDFVVVIDSWVHIIVRSITGKDFFARVAIFRAFRGLLVLKHIRFFGDVIAIMIAVKRSVRPLENVIMLTGFLLIFYALLGTQFLQKTMSSRCIRKTDKQVSYPERFCDKKVVDAYICPSNQKCSLYGNPNWGCTSFDYVYDSLITMFQVISLEGWSLIMYRIKDSEGERADSYFMSMVVIGTYFLCNVFIAGISGVFLRVRSEHQALLKRARQTEVSFYAAAQMAKVFKSEIIKDDTHLRWHQRFLNKSRRAQRSVMRALSRTQSSMVSALQSGSFRMNRTYSGTLNRSMSRGMSRSMTMGARAAATVSDHCRAVVDHPSFKWGVLLSVTVNAIVLSLYKYGMSKKLLYIMYALQAMTLVSFSGELLLRFLAYGPVSFFSDRMNLLDLVVVPVSIGALTSRAYPNISAIRILRWYYYSKKDVDKNPSVVATCMKSVGSLVGVFFFYVILLVVFSIISMELYSGQYYKFAEGYPRANHDSMLLTMLLWFTVTTSESWPNNLWNSLRPGVEYNWVAPFLYIFYYVLTVFIVMNLIIAVLLEKTELTDNEKKQIQRVDHMKLIRRMQSRAYTRSGSWVVGAVEGVRAGFGSFAYRLLSMNVRPVKSNKREQDRRAQRRERDAPEAEGAAENSKDAPPRRGSRNSVVLESSGFPENLNERRGSRTALQDAALTLAEVTAPPVGRVLSRSSSNRQSFQLSDYMELERSLSSRERPWYLKEGSLFLFSEDSSIKKYFKLIVTSIWWKYFALVWVAIGTWNVAEHKPDGEYIFTQPLFHAFDAVIVGVFGAEFIMQVSWQGLIFSPDAYLGDPYNLMELFILIIDVLNLIPWPEKSERVIHALLAFRPFRFVARVSGLRKLLSNLFKTLPAIANVLLFTFMIFLIFATVGIQVFRGLLYSCNDSTITHRSQCVGFYYNDVSLLVPRVWENLPLHFDDIGNALLSLFVCSTFDNWVQYWLFPSMDIVGQDRQPVREYSPHHALFFVAFCCAGGFFIVRVFIGVFISEFGRNSGSKLLTERQKLWRDMNRIIQKMKPSSLPRVPKLWIRKKCYYAIRNPYYKATMVICLLGYSGFLASNNAKQPAFISMRRQKAHCAITTYFLMESITKFLGDEFRVYRRDHSKHMEFGISILASSGLMAPKGTVKGYIGRFAYIIRVFCIIPHVPRARVIMRTLFICLPTMGEIMGLLTIFLFAFAGIGFQMFSQVKDGMCIGPTLNFRTFVNSFVTVFQVTTLDNWSCIMLDVMQGPPLCSAGNSLYLNDCGYPFAGVIYFVALIVVASHIFMNLFVAIILDAITFGLVNENSMITPDHLHDYKLLWQKKPFDPDATGYIGIHKLKQFVDELGSPLGRRHNSPVEWYIRVEYEAMSFRVPNKGVPFKQLLETLTLYKIGPTGLPLSLRIEREKRIQTIYRTGAATKCQALARGFLSRRRVARIRSGQAPPHPPPRQSEAGGGTEVRSSAMLVEETGGSEA